MEQHFRLWANGEQRDDLCRRAARGSSVKWGMLELVVFMGRSRGLGRRSLELSWPLATGGVPGVTFPSPSRSEF